MPRSPNPRFDAKPATCVTKKETRLTKAKSDSGLDHAIRKGQKVHTSTIAKLWMKMGYRQRAHAHVFNLQRKEAQREAQREEAQEEAQSNE